MKDEGNCSNGIDWSWGDEYEKVKHAAHKRILLPKTLEVILCPNGDESEGDLEDDAYEASEEMNSNLGDLFNEESEVVLESLVASSQIERERDLDGKEELEDDPLSTRFLTATLWNKTEFIPPPDTSWKDKLQIDEEWDTKTPLQYFHLIFDEELIGYIACQTNIYALQSKGVELGLQEQEMKAFLGILMKFGILKPPTYRYFWKTFSRYDVVANTMTGDRFLQIKSFLHFADNSMQKPADDPEHDKLFKIRPILESVRRNCQKIPQEEHQCIDRQIIPTKTQGALKEYNPKKPQKWGYKVISRAGASGFVYDFLIYTGKGSVENTNNVGMPSAYVLALAKDVPKHKNYKLYYDNWFSSLSLARILKTQGILCLSTVRANRLKGVVLKDDNSLKREGRGSADFCVEQITDTVVVKWYDNKFIHLLSNYAGIHPTDTCKIWDKKEKKRVDLERPYAVKEYNEFMGGGDLSDMLIELYRINFKSRKWYIRIFLYLIDLSVVNAWILYRRVKSITKSGKPMSLCDFKDDISAGLMTMAINKRETTSLSQNENNKKPYKPTARPADSTRFDCISHWPECIDKQNRCRQCKNSHTKVLCVKCKVGLCLTKKKNCFTLYHQR